MPKPKIEIADILQRYGHNYHKQRGLSLQQYKAMSAITQCRSATLGGHMNACNNCGATDISYNSCRNRHCPKCQTVDKLRWVAKRGSELLPVTYFHVVFTLPHDLNPLVMSNQNQLYQLLFKSVSKTLLTFGQDKKRLGGEIGATLVLHTWGQALDLHPHLHCIVPGGALATNGNWIATKSNYLFPVKAMANFFKRCFLTELKQLFQNEQLQFYGQAIPLKQCKNFNTLCDKLWHTSWIVYAKPPFANAQTVVRYLGRYTHRIAIANHRLIGIDNDKVIFHWRDYRDDNKQKNMTLSAEEFIRRFFLHVLPSGFTRIRHIGFLANRYKAKKLQQCCDALEHQQTTYQNETVAQILLRVANLDIWQCKHCDNGKKQIVLTLYNNHTEPIVPKVA